MGEGFHRKGKQMQRFCLMLDLRDDAALIAEYIEYHRNVWPEIKQSIRDAGVLDMQIYNAGRRLFMILDADDGFTFERKSAMDSSNPKVMEWEELMAGFQQVEAGQDPTRRWQLMDRIFELSPQR
jgi:L-rhamnose mutarotase